jgi:lipooligosaccharide transport system permease protein
MSTLSVYFKVPRLSHRLWKIWSRNKEVFMKTIKTDLLIPLLEPLLYLAALGFGLGFFINEINGVSYAEFIAPGLVSIAIMYAAFAECTYSSFVRMYYNKIYDAIIATPVSLEEVVAGELLWGATKGTINGTIVLAVITALGLVNGPLFITIIPLSFMVGLMFSSIAMCCTAIVPSIDGFNYPQFLFITPMFLFSGTYFPITILPQFIQIIAQALLPLTHTVNIIRGLTLSTMNLSMLTSLLWIIGVTIVFFILSVNLMKKRLIR